MVTPDPVVNFRFDFADLRRIEPPPLELIRPRLQALEGPTSVVSPAPLPRPAWLPRLLPVLRVPEPMRIDVVDVMAPVWAGRITASLAALMKAAGAEANLEVITWDGGLAVGGPRFAHVPVEAHSVVLSVEWDHRSLPAALDRAAEIDPDRLFVAVLGGRPGREAALRVERPVARAGRVFHFPALAGSEIEAFAGGLPPAVFSRSLGTSTLALARALLERYCDLAP